MQQFQKTAEEYQKKAEKLSAENKVFEFICHLTVANMSLSS